MVSLILTAACVFCEGPAVERASLTVDKLPSARTSIVAPAVGTHEVEYVSGAKVRLLTDPLHTWLASMYEMLSKSALAVKAAVKASSMIVRALIIMVPCTPHVQCHAVNSLKTLNIVPAAGSFRSPDCWDFLQIFHT
jgi:hypothetical protein